MVRVVHIFMVIGLFFNACTYNVQSTNSLNDPKISETIDSIVDKMESIAKKNQIDTNRIQLNDSDTLVSVNRFNKNIWWELKYATSDNFMKRVLYDTLNQVFVQKIVAERLAKCQQYLEKIAPGMHLLVYDGVRPLSVQWEMWNALDTIPVAERGKFVSNPVNGSVHNYGCAIDLTICDSNHVVLDMGAGYDDIRKIAYPSLEKQFLETGELSQKQVANRSLLRKVMGSQGFMNIPSEWWHFNAFTRPVAKSKFSIILNEF